MPRPKSPAKKRHAVQVLFADDEYERFERLLAVRIEELRGEGVEYTGPMLIRWLIAREIAARGLDKPSGETASSTKPPGARKGTAR